MLLYTFTALFLISICLAEDRPHVKIPLGEVRGTFKLSNRGRKYSSFEGIPYAKPPIGQRRFEEPQAIEPWKGVWDAIFPTTCAQTVLPNFKFTQQVTEDCLHINVYIPREKINPEEQLEVIVTVHGGAYMYGSGTSYISPQFFMDHDVIFVTFNYRLGILGFLSTEDDVLPGNNGLKDQVMALRWIQENIAAFGGNPRSVTLTGGSAGASSVHLHYFSEMSKGLFHRGFSFSGAALNSFTLQEEASAKARVLAEAVGCPNFGKKMVECLKERPYQHLLDKMGLFYGYKSGFPFAPFAPVVEKGSRPFLKEDPYKLLVEGRVNDVPWIASNTAHEGGFSLMYVKDDFEKLNEEWEDVAPYLLDFNYTLPRSLWKKISRKIKEFYLDEEKFGEETMMKMINMFGDRIFLVDAEEAVRLQAKVNKSPVYYYRFAYLGDNNPVGLVSHGFDAKYFYGDVIFNQPLTVNENKMKDVMMEMLISYSKLGKPTIEGVTWEPTGHKELKFLNISSFKRENIKMEKSEELTPRSFWKSLGFKENSNLFVIKEEL